MSTIAQMIPGEKARIVKFTDDFLSLKLMEMGCLPGEQVEFKRTAPLGDPIEISVSGYLLSMRKAEAQTVIVEKGE